MSNIVIRDGEAFHEPGDGVEADPVDVRRVENERLMALADRLPNPDVEAAADPSPTPSASDEPVAPGKGSPVATLAKSQPLVRVRLTWPLTIEGQRIGWVPLWPPSHGDVEAVAKGRMSIADMVTRMAGLPDGALGSLRIDDSDRIVSIALFLAPEGLQP